MLSKNSRNLVIFAPGKTDAYHGQVSPPSGQLRPARVRAIQSASSGICGDGGDDLIMADGGVSPQRLAVTGNWRSHIHLN